MYSKMSDKVGHILPHSIDLTKGCQAGTDEGYQSLYHNVTRPVLSSV